MKPTLRIAPALAGFLLAGAAAAQQPAERQEPSQEDLVAWRDAKLAKPFVAHGGWIADYDQARALARERGQVIFAYFSRSYAP